MFWALFKWKLKERTSIDRDQSTWRLFCFTWQPTKSSVLPARMAEQEHDEVGIQCFSSGQLWTCLMFVKAEALQEVLWAWSRVVQSRCACQYQEFCACIQAQTLWTSWPSLKPDLWVSKHKIIFVFYKFCFNSITAEVRETWEKYFFLDLEQIHQKTKILWPALSLIMTILKCRATAPSLQLHQKKKPPKKNPTPPN